jgi:hypothetical protein
MGKEREMEGEREMERERWRERDGERDGEREIWRWRERERDMERDREETGRARLTLRRGEGVEVSQQALRGVARGCRLRRAPRVTPKKHCDSALHHNRSCCRRDAGGWVLCSRGALFAPAAGPGPGLHGRTTFGRSAACGAPQRSPRRRAAGAASRRGGPGHRAPSARTLLRRRGRRSCWGGLSGLRRLR